MHDVARTFQMYAQREFLTLDECQELIDIAEAVEGWLDYELAPDQVGNGVRQHIVDLRHSHFQELHDRTFSFLTEVNDECWHFTLNHWHQPMRIARYLPGYRHDWHTDYTGDDASKLAFSMPLNAGYRGGELQLLETERIDQHPGHAVIFPAFQGHRVTEVEAGVRYVLLGWLTGPRFI